MVIDLRSDTFTLPTPAMKAAMMEAPLGDDVFGEDPTVNRLQEKMAALFGMEGRPVLPLRNDVQSNSYPGAHSTPGRGDLR